MYSENKNTMKKYLKPILAVLIFIALQGIAGLTTYVGSLMDIRTSQMLPFVLILSGIITVVILYFMNMIRPRIFNIFHHRWRYTPLAIIAALFGIFALNLISEQLDLPDLMKADIKEMIRNRWGIFAVAFFAPLVEELVFRESIIGTMLRNGAHRWQAILFSAILFGVVHFNPSQMFFAFAMGIILGVIFTKTGNIGIPLLIHVINNTVAIMQIKLLGEKVDEYEMTDVLGGTIMAWGCIIFCLFLCTMLLVIFWKRYHHHHHRHHKKDDSKPARMELRHELR